MAFPVLRLWALVLGLFLARSWRVPSGGRENDGQINKNEGRATKNGTQIDDKSIKTRPWVGVENGTGTGEHT